MEFIVNVTTSKAKISPPPYLMVMEVNISLELLLFKIREFDWIDNNFLQ